MGSSAFPHSLLPSPSLPRLSSIASFPPPTCLKFSSNTCNRARAFSFHDNSPDPELPEGDSSPELPQDGAPRKPKKPKKEKLPNGLRRYQTMAILRPDITEDERIDWTQRYEEAIIAGGAVSVEFFNRGIMPLAYTVKKKDMGGVASRYLDGIYMVFTYVTKPQSQLELQRKFNTDDDIIRSTTVLLK